MGISLLGYILFLAIQDILIFLSHGVSKVNKKGGFKTRY